MSKTSIHISPVKSSSEVHNFRDKDLDYVRKDLTHLNESWSCESIQSRLSAIKDRYKATTGQTMQKKAVPIREGVAVIDNNTTMDQLKDFANKCHERFGITVFQIHIHRDEGHRGSKEWKPNLHAHLVIDWTDTSGKSIKTKRQDFAQMQTLLSESLGMERGQSSDRKHLDSIQYKTNAKSAELENIQKEIKNLRPKKALKQVIVDAIGNSKKTKDIQRLAKELHNQKKILKGKERELKTAQNILKDKDRRIERISQQNKTMEQEFCTILDKINLPEGVLKTLRQLAPTLMKVYNLTKTISHEAGAEM